MEFDEMEIDEIDARRARYEGPSVRSFVIRFFGLGIAIGFGIGFCIGVGLSLGGLIGG